MASVSTYLNFATSTEEAFNFYKTVFGGEFTAPGIGVWVTCHQWKECHLQVMI
ncbi:hypothetical protein [Ferruginibacter sp.]